MAVRALSHFLCNSPSGPNFQPSFLFSSSSLYLPGTFLSVSLGFEILLKSFFFVLSWFMFLSVSIFHHNDYSKPQIPESLTFLLQSLLLLHFCDISNIFCMLQSDAHWNTLFLFSNDKDTYSIYTHFSMHSAVISRLFTVRKTRKKCCYRNSRLK